MHGVFPYREMARSKFSVVSYHGGIKHHSFLLDMSLIKIPPSLSLPCSAVFSNYKVCGCVHDGAKLRCQEILWGGGGGGGHYNK